MPMPTRTTPREHDPATPEREDATPLTPEERARLLAELEAELEAGERSIREEGTITAEELQRHMDALFARWEAEETATAKDDKA